MRPLLASLVLVLTSGCAAPAGAHGSNGGLVRAGTPDGVNIAASREREQRRAFEWSRFEPAAFARAKRENKLILLDGAAEWCHWCHVMDETTYLDPEVGA